MQIRVLLVEDNEGYARLVQEMLKEVANVSYEVDWRDSIKAALERIGQGGLDVILLDLSLPDSPRGVKTLAAVQEKSPGIPIVVLTSYANETFAINALQGGAQDYLVKRYVDAELLERTIRYAIARNRGETRRLSLTELREYDGKEGRPAYIAYKGKVYDVTRSKLWRNGGHMGAHFAGRDLSGGLHSAPHGAEVLLMFHLVGELLEEETPGKGLIKTIEKLHLHPIAVHFSAAYSISVPLFSVLFLIFRHPSLEQAAWYMLILGLLSAPITAYTGYFSWKTSYGGKMNYLFQMKIIWTYILLTLTFLSFALRFTHPAILMMPDLQYIYLALIIGLIPSVTMLGHYGGKIVYS